MKVKKEHVWIFSLALVSIVSFYFISKTFVQNPLVFGDEGYYAYLGQYIGSSLSIPESMHVYGSNTLYAPFVDNPLPFLLVAGGFAVGEIGVKLIDPFVYLLTGLMSFIFARRMFSTKVGVFAAFLFFIMPQVVTYSALLYADILFTLLVLLSFYFLYRGVDEDSRNYLIISGVFAGLSLLTKDTGALMGLVYLLIIGICKKDFFRRILAVGLPFGVIGFSWILFNNIIFHGAGLEAIPLFGRFLASAAAEQAGLQFSDDIARVGSNQSYLGLGILNYISFAYTIPIFMLAILGISYLYIKPDKRSHFISIWIAVFLGIILIQMGSVRSEDLSRFTLAASVPIAIAAAVFLGKFYDHIKEMWEGFGKFIAVIGIVLILLLGMASAGAKAESLDPVKKFSPAFFEGCDWIRENTEEDAAIFTLWAHRARYHCERDTHFTKLENHAVIMLSGDERTHEELSRQGMDYVFIQKFSIQFTDIVEAYPTQFVTFVRNSPDKFQLVHEYPQNCMDRQASDCVIIYKVL